MVQRLLTDVREMFAEQYHFRELLYQMTMRDLRIRYKQTIMGFGWAVFMPIVNTIVFSTIFTRVARIQTDVPYPIYAFSGLLAWNFFASSLRFSVNSLTGNTSLVTKIYFPREIFPFSAILVSLMDFMVAGCVLAGLMVYYGIGVNWSVLFLPVVVIVQMAFTAGVALLLAMGNLFYRDVKYLFEVVITAWMFATAVIYPTHIVGGFLGTLLAMNPMTPIIDAYRSVILRGTLPPPGPFLAAAAVSFVMLAVGWTVFHRGEYSFAESI
jgi:ABC-type polysaccharide/polyol phosphate export permease